MYFLRNLLTSWFPAKIILLPKEVVPPGYSRVITKRDNFVVTKRDNFVVAYNYVEEDE